MYKSDEELFGEVVSETGLSRHPRFMNLSACVSTLLSLKVGNLSDLPHEEVLILARKFGFEFESHNEARIVVLTIDRFYELREAHDLAERKAPFRCFDAHFFRDRNGRLMATFSMGTTTFRRIELDESWEQKFASVYQDTLVEALKLGVGSYGVHEPEDASSDDD